VRAKELLPNIVRMALAVYAALLLSARIQTVAAQAATQPATQPAPASAVSMTNPLAGRTVEGVQIRGNPTVPESLIRNVIRTKEGTPFDPASVQDDYQRIFQLKKFKNVEAQVEPTSTGGVVVVFVVQEQTLLKKISYHGNTSVETTALQGVVDIKVGQAVDWFRISLARQAIANLYRDKNYPFSHVDVPTDAITQRGELIFNIVEGPHVEVRNIRFVGAHSFAEDELRKQVKSATWFPIFSAGKYDSDQVDQDMGALRKYYKDHGFFDIRVGRKLIVSPDQTELQIDFIIDEGVRYIVDHIAFAGNKKLSDVTLRNGLNLRPGRSFDAELAQRDVQEIVKKYSPLGYIYIAPGMGRSDPDYLTISAQPVFLREPGRIEMLYVIQEGKPFHVGLLQVKGNDKSQDKLVTREFREFVPGSLYDSATVQDGLERLRALPYFQSVNATPIGDDANERNLLVTVQEQRTASFNIGAGLSSNGGLSGNIVYQQRNFDIANVPDNWRDILSDKSFTGAGQGLRISLAPGTIYSSADVRFSEPWLFDQPYQFIEDVYLRDAVRETYTDRRIGNEITFGKYLDYQNSVSLTLRAEQVSIFGVQDPRFRPAEVLRQRGTHPLTAVGLQYQRDTTNPGFVTYRGTNFTAGVEGFGALGGDYTFQRYAVGWSGYKTLYTDLLDRQTVLEARLNAGFMTGNSVFFERFYGGDLGSVRGFRYRGISPRGGRGNDPVGGDFYFTGSGSVSFPIYQNVFRAVLFADFGDVENDVRVGVVRASVGPGVRFTLPILGSTPISIYFGYPLVKGRNDDTQYISFQFGGLLQ
jgi:outer membrane protein insertion porin family